MWAYAVARRSVLPFSVWLSPRCASSLNGLNTTGISRHFSSDNNNGGQRSSNNKKQTAARNNNNNRRPNNRNQKNRGRRPKKTSFSDQFLEPAARGELRHHKSGIPKLAGRKPKGHGVRAADVLPEKEEEEEEWDLDELDDDGTAVDFSPKRKEKKSTKSGTIAKNSPMEELNAADYKAVMDFFDAYQEIANMADDEPYYWKEVDYDESGETKRLQMLEKLKEDATKDADGNLVVEVEDDVFDMFEAAEEKADEKPENRPRRQGGFGNIDDDPNFKFVMENMGIDSGKLPPGPGYDQVMPLEVQGSDMSDFVEAMMKHPTKFSELRYSTSHPESVREPLPDAPPTRANPSSEFLESHMRFIYVWGLPELIVDGKPGDVQNPLHRLEIQKTVAGLFGVQPESISVANLTSAFVGLPTAVDQRVALVVGPAEKVIESPVRISIYDPDSSRKKLAIAKDSADSLVLLENLPLGSTASSLAKTLFPAGSEVGEVYGSISVQDVVMISPNSAVVKFESSEVAEQAIHSSIVQQRLTEIGQHRVRYSKARRELVYTGLHGGPGGQDRLRKLGSRMIVDGDMPTKKFFLSHAGTLLLRNLDPSVTKQDVSNFFQEYCTVPRDVEGSIEFVTCQEGLPTGRAYVGFDELGEAEAAMDALSAKGGRIASGTLGVNPVIVMTVKELNKKVKRERRQTRSDEEILDSLHNWEQFVDPADVDELIEMGVSKEVLDETLRAIRYQNPTFASLDQAMRSETLDPDMEVGGMYRQLVQEYIATLKECIATPEEPGLIYESLFAPGEEIDTEIFEDEVDRQAELEQKRKIP
eukprot:scaffold22586_cov138-Cylindrotheca_fusiformis.AAC.5